MHISTLSMNWTYRAVGALAQDVRLCIAAEKSQHDITDIKARRGGCDF